MRKKKKDREANPSRRQAKYQAKHTHTHTHTQTHHNLNPQRTTNWRLKIEQRGETHNPETYADHYPKS